MRARLAIPRRLRIRGEAWRVVLTPDPPLVRGQACAGSCNHLRREIAIWRGLSRPRREVVFAHELVHALSGRRRSMAELAQEERVARRLAGPLRALLVSGRRWRAPRRCAAARAVSAAGAVRGR